MAFKHLCTCSQPNPASIHTINRPSKVAYPCPWIPTPSLQGLHTGCLIFLWSSSGQLSSCLGTCLKCHLIRVLRGPSILWLAGPLHRFHHFWEAYAFTYVVSVSPTGLWASQGQSHLSHLTQAHSTLHPVSSRTFLYYIYIFYFIHNDTYKPAVCYVTHYKKTQWGLYSTAFVCVCASEVCIFKPLSIIYVFIICLLLCFICKKVIWGIT